MSNTPGASAEAAGQRLSTASTLARLALIGVALAAVIAAFAYLGGWFTPNDLIPARFTDGFEEVYGVHPGFRRNHAKGVGVSGFFREQRKRRSALESGCLPARSCAGSRPFLARGRQSLRARHVVHPAR